MKKEVCVLESNWIGELIQASLRNFERCIKMWIKVMRCKLLSLQYSRLIDVAIFIISFMCVVTIIHYASSFSHKYIFKHEVWVGVL